MMKYIDRHSCSMVKLYDIEISAVFVWKIIKIKTLEKIILNLGNISKFSYKFV